RIIRESDEPRPELMARWDLSEAQAEAILNMRLRSLRKLEEIELRKELAGLEKEEGEINRLLAEDKRQWKTIAWEIGETRKELGGATALGKRRSESGQPPAAGRVPVEPLAERGPLTEL